MSHLKFICFHVGRGKTLEGTLAAISSQAIILPILIQLGFLQASPFLVVKFSVTIIINSIVETFTDQVDNLTLPLITYILLSL